VEGVIEAGTAVELVERPNPEWTVARANHVMYSARTDAVLTAALATIPGLSTSWQSALLERADQLLGG